MTFTPEFVRAFHVVRRGKFTTIAWGRRATGWNVGIVTSVICFHPYFNNSNGDCFHTMSCDVEIYLVGNLLAFILVLMQVEVLYIRGPIRRPLLLNRKGNSRSVPGDDGKRGLVNAWCTNDFDCFDVVAACGYRWLRLVTNRDLQAGKRSEWFQVWRRPVRWRASAETNLNSLTYHQPWHQGRTKSWTTNPGKRSARRDQQSSCVKLCVRIVRMYSTVCLLFMSEAL